MGYYTNYKLSYSKLTAKLEEVLHSDNWCSYSPLWSFVTEYAESCKWYDHEVDMLALSKQFPVILFTLEGRGEEAGDLWIKYFKNGKIQKCPGKIIYDEFDETKLK